jgi:hypothetical protein
MAFQPPASVTVSFTSTALAKLKGPPVRTVGESEHFV